MTHTPGPWYADAQGYSSSSFYIRGSDSDGKQLTWGKGAVAHIPRSTVMPSEANANLIAAAPDLLAALERLLKWAIDVHDPRTRTHINYAGMDQARDAIAKAAGEQA